MVVERLRSRSFAIGRSSGRALLSKHDQVVVEEPLEIRVGGEPLAVIMRTPGNDIELALGLLSGEEVLSDPDDLGTVRHCSSPDQEEDENAIDVQLSEDRVHSAAAAKLKATRSLLTSTSCGVCGKRLIEALHQSAGPFERPAAPVSDDLVASLPGRMRREQALFDSTGGIHAAAVFSSEGELLVAMEDVGRHNAVDKCIGALFLRELLPVESSILLVSGRASFEIVQKALVARVQTVVAVSAPSSLSVDLARASRMNLYGFVRNGSFNVYAGDVSSSSPSSPSSPPL